MDEYDDYQESSVGKKIGIAIGVIILLIVIVIAVLYFVKQNKNKQISQIIVAKKDEPKDTKTKLLMYRFNLTPGTGHWNYIYIDDRILDKIKLNGYTHVDNGGIIVNTQPTTEFSKKVTIYADTSKKTGGYFIGEGTVPSGSTITGIFYTYDGEGINTTLADFNNSVMFCNSDEFYNARLCNEYGTNPFKFVRPPKT